MYHSQIGDLSKVDPQQCSPLLCSCSKYLQASPSCCLWLPVAVTVSAAVSQLISKFLENTKVFWIQEYMCTTRKSKGSVLSAAVHVLVLWVSRHWFQWGLLWGDLKQKLSNRVELYGPNFSKPCQTMKKRCWTNTNLDPWVAMRNWKPEEQKPSD